MTRRAKRHQKSGLMVVCLLVTGAQVGIGACRDFKLEPPTVGSGTTGLGGRAEAGAGGRPTASTGGDSGYDGSGGDLDSGSPPREVEEGKAGAWSSGHGDEAGGGASGAVNGGDGGIGVGGEDMGLAVSPASLSGLALWLESSLASIAVDVAGVSAWKDSSPAKQVATAPSHARPHFSPNGINDLPIVIFNGASSMLQVLDNDALHFETEPFTVAFVGEWHNDETPTYTIENGSVKVSYPGYGAIIKKVGAAPYDGIQILANTPAPYAQTPAMRRLGVQLRLGEAAMHSKASDLNDGKFRLYVVQRSERSLLEERINGSPQGSVDIPKDLNVNAPTRPLQFGGEAGQPFMGSLAEVVIVKGRISESELAGLELYLMRKFAL